jgi:hypothetical protein
MPLLSCVKTQSHYTAPESTDEVLRVAPSLAPALYLEPYLEVRMSDSVHGPNGPTVPRGSGHGGRICRR